VTTKTQQYLQSIGACAEARAWVGERTLKQAWESCERLDWLKWLLRAPINAEYEAEYEAKCAPINAEYEAKRATVDAEYAAKLAPIDAEYWTKLAPIDAEYAAKRATIDAEYWAKLAPVYACRTCKEIRSKFACPEVE
jgi:hypothetical protein